MVSWCHATFPSSKRGLLVSVAPVEDRNQGLHSLQNLAKSLFMTSSNVYTLRFGNIYANLPSPIKQLWGFVVLVSVSSFLVPSSYVTFSHFTYFVIQLWIPRCTWGFTEVKSHTAVHIVTSASVSLETALSTSALTPMKDRTAALSVVNLLGNLLPYEVTCSFTRETLKG